MKKDRAISDPAGFFDNLIGSILGWLNVGLPTKKKPRSLNLGFLCFSPHPQKSLGREGVGESAVTG
jgi:hypothetical protein